MGEEGRLGRGEMIDREQEGEERLGLIGRVWMDEEGRMKWMGG